VDALPFARNKKEGVEFHIIALNLYLVYMEEDQGEDRDENIRLELHRRGSTTVPLIYQLIKILKCILQFFSLPQIDLMTVLLTIITNIQMNYQPMSKFLVKMETKSLNSMVYLFEFQFI
jgi:hypothetical protein